MSARSILPANTVLDGKYRIDFVLGTGGFGITYAAHDLGLNTTVAVKEYFPAQLASRDSSRMVRPSSHGQKELFEHLKASFVREAQTLIKFRHPSIARVLSVFEANGTAYMVMEFEQGQSLKAWLAELGRPPNQAELDGIVMPLLDALEIVHGANYLHRDIAPDNIIIRPDGSPVLLDFGSARQVTDNMTGIVKSGYSPQEQYAQMTNLQGPWTDIYALGATVYAALTGRAPEQAMGRAIEDTTVPLVEAGLDGYRPSFLAGVDAAMRLQPADRPQSIAQFRDMIHPGGVRDAQGAAQHSDAQARRAQLPGAVPLVGFGSGNGAGMAIAGTSAEPDTADDVALSRDTAALASAPAAAQGRVLIFAGVAGVVLLGGIYLLAQGGSRRDTVEPPRTTPAVTIDFSEVSQSPSRAYENGKRYLDGTGVAENYPKARQFFETAAARGHGPSMNMLGQIYRHGWGVAQSYVTARQWYERAIATGDKDGMSNLGLLFEEGHGVAKDLEQAREWYEKAAALGNEIAMQNLALLYRDGRGVTQDDVKALSWHEKSALAGNATSMNWIGRHFQEGWGAPVDLAASRNWFLKAAEAGSNEGMWNVAVLLDEAKGGPANPAQAARWLLDAAKAGHADARTHLVGDMSSWASSTRIEAKRELKRRRSFAGALTDAWTDEARKTIEDYLAE